MLSLAVLRHHRQRPRGQSVTKLLERATRAVCTEPSVIVINLAPAASTEVRSVATKGLPVCGHCQLLLSTSSPSPAPRMGWALTDVL